MPCASLRLRRALIPAVGVASPFILAGCSGVQSALDPAGKDAEVLANLFWVLLAGAGVLWLSMNGFFFYVNHIKERRLSRSMGEALIIGGGIVFPVITLGALLSYALSIMPDQRMEGSGLTLRVTGKQWWWRVEYWPDGAIEPVVSANEVRLPTGRRTEIKLAADQVIHSFWVPALAGKMDMLPGLETRLALEPTRTGIYRGQCAEFCGPSHALMAFNAVVMEADDFDAWLERERGPAMEPASDEARRGKELFLSQGCGACHAIRGTAAQGQVGPDLTHVGGRTSLAAGTLPPSAEAHAKWIRHAPFIKPEARMPAFDHLSERDLAALGAYLEVLK